MKQPFLPDSSFEGLEDIARRLSNLLRVGVIVQADYPQAKVKVNYGQDEQGQDLVTGWLPWMTQRAGNDVTWHAPEVGEQVMVFSPSGDPQLGLVFMSLYQQAKPAPANRATVHRTEYDDGAIIEYDRAAHRLTASLPNGGTTILTSPGGVTINGNVSINGDVDVSGGDVTADGISLKTHKHPGDSGGVTGQPQ